MNLIMIGRYMFTSELGGQIIGVSQHEINLGSLVFKQMDWIKSSIDKQQNGVFKFFAFSNPSNNLIKSIFLQHTFRESL